MKITINTIPHNEQRYETVGDWLFDDNDDLIINVSDSKNWKYSLLVGVHELIEVALCKDRGITDEEVTKFDVAFEANRMEGNEDEPGDDPNCPCRKEHFFATSIERLIAAELGVDWSEYDKAIYSL